MSRFSSIVKRLSFVAILLCLSMTVAGLAKGQQQSGAGVVGTVTDASGGLVPRATVTITNLATSISQQATTGDSGDYSFSLLQPGPYTVKIEAKGFKTFSTPNFALATGDRARIDAKMEVGETTQTVEVSGQVAPALETDTATVSTLITTQETQDTPLDGRNVFKLVQLAAGVSQGTPNDLMTGARPDDRRQTSAFSANGQPDNVNNLTVDGMDNNDHIIGTTVLRPSIDAIQEVNVQTDLYDASVTRSSGAVVDIITKSGNNNFHGTLYEFVRSDALNTNPGYAFPASLDPTTGAVIDTTVAPKPPFKQNQYGGSLGGPILKDKTFFFVDFERFNRKIGLPITSTVPTACEKGVAACPDGATQFGDFSDSPPITAPFPNNAETCSIGTPTGPGQIQYGTPGCPYVVIPSASITTLGRAYFNLYPLPTNPGLVNNYTRSAGDTQNQTTFDIRIDQHFSSKDTVFGRYSFNDAVTVTPDAFPAVRIDPATGNVVTTGGVSVRPSGGSFGGINNFPGDAKERAQGLVLSWVHVFSPNLVLSLKGGFDRLTDASLALNTSSDAANKLGFPCNSVSCVNYGALAASGIPSLAITSYTPIGDAAFLPIIYFDTTFEYNGVVTWNKGPHTIRFGAQLLRRRSTQGQSNEPNGGWDITGGYTGQQGGDLLEGLSAGGGGVDIGTFFLGLGLRSNSLVQPGLRNWEPGVFVQDDWRATHWLTLNLGARYDIFTPPTEKFGRQDNWNPANGYFEGPGLPGIQQSGPTAGVNTHYGNIAPRIGFAATLKDNMVLRGGFGMTYYQGTIGPLKNPPYAYQLNCSAQNTFGSNTPCPAPFANSAVQMYGLPGGFSQVGGMGGAFIPAGIPVPTENILPVLPPTTCPVAAVASSVGCSAAGGNGYATLGIAATWPHQPTPYLEQYSLQLQKAYKDNLFQIGYVGEFGRHQVGGVIPLTIINSTQAATTLAAEGLGSPLAAQYPWLNTNTISPTAHYTTSSYNALQAAFIRRYQNGLTVNVNYTWSHSLANGQGGCTPTFSPADFGYGTGAKYILPCYYDNAKNTAAPFVENSIDDGRGRVGNTGSDVPNRIAGTVNYQLQVGKNATGVKGVLIKGWSTNVAGYWQSGLPFVVGNGDPRTGTNVVGGGLDQTCSGRLSHPTKVNWFNEACFSQPTISTWGTYTLNQLFGPRQRGLDFSLFKDFQLTERFRLQFRTEVFNLFNTPNFAPPGGSPGTNPPTVNIPRFTVPCADNPAQTCGAGAASANSAVLPIGAITSLNPNTSSREIQFALKLLF